MKLRFVGRSCAAVAGLLLLTGCASDPPNAGRATPTPKASQDVVEGKDGDRPAAVEIIDTDFLPVSTTIEKGSHVEWVQVGDQAHSVTAVDGSFDSNPDCGPIESDQCMGEGDEFRHTFQDTGEFTYYCRVHGLPDGTGMVGTIVVE